MDAFFAAVELLRRPQLRGAPVVIGGRGDPSRRGVVSTASYEARRFGVRSGMPLSTAARLCPQAVYLPVDFAEYARWSRRFKAVMRSVSPLLEDAGIDEAYLDISTLPQASEAIARRIKEGIRRECGGLSCSIGIAPNKLLAKIASELDKPDGLTVIALGDLRRRIWPLAARRLPGVGPKAEKRLAEIGIRTIGELACAPLALLAQRFGRAQAFYLHQAANGEDDSPIVVAREPKSHSRETTFPRDIADPAELRRVIAQLADEVAAELRTSGYRARNVAVKLRSADFRTFTRARSLAQPSDDPGIIRTAALDCLERAPRTGRVRLLGVRAAALERAAARQPQLDFGAADPGSLRLRTSDR